MIPICETAKLLQLRKAKHSILSSILHIFQKMLLKGPYTCTIHCINLMIFLYCFKSGHLVFKKCDFLEKFILSFFFEQDLMER